MEIVNEFELITEQTNDEYKVNNKLICNPIRYREKASDYSSKGYSFQEGQTEIYNWNAFVAASP